MKNNNKYIVVQDNKELKAVNLKINKVYDMSSKNKIDGGIKINKINLVEQEFIDKVLDKKISRRFKKLLELIASITENDEEPSSGLMYALDETERLKREIINKYNHLIKKEELELIDKKLMMIEKELKKRLYEHQMVMKIQQKLMQQSLLNTEEKEEVNENHRRR